MFEKEAEEYVDLSGNRNYTERAFKDGAEFGYQEGLKAKVNATTISDCPVKDEWHYPSKGEFPNCTRQVLICYGMEERMKFVYWRADLGTFGSALPIEITAWRYIEPPKEEE